MADPRPIGIFDSGIGGLTVLRAVAGRLPAERLVYLGDTARVPYGTKSAGTVSRYTRQCARFLLSRDVKALVVACNTASALAMDALRGELPVAGMPVLGVIEPGAVEACRVSTGGRVGVIGTASTIRSGAYARAIKAIRPDFTVTGVACPLFVPLAEEGWIDPNDDVAHAVAARYLGSLVRERIDTLILGCTHYPLLRGVIERALGEAAAGIALVDSGAAVAHDLARLLAARGMQAAGAPAPGGASGTAFAG
ncbi:MAG TPA: glutamate racemase, partial [Candidatus Polarisedimenticolia bacterium]|nr:glutamate racemase [Candidatus Polarisedimenticolia bacterium]